MPEITEAMDRERMQAPKKTCTGFRRLRSHWDAQGRRKTAKPRNHCGHKGRSPWRYGVTVVPICLQCLLLVTILLPLFFFFFFFLKVRFQLFVVSVQNHNCYTEVFSFVRCHFFPFSCEQWMIASVAQRPSMSLISIKRIIAGVIGLWWYIILFWF